LSKSVFVSADWAKAGSVLRALTDRYKPLGRNDAAEQLSGGRGPAALQIGTKDGAATGRQTASNAARKNKTPAPRGTGVACERRLKNPEALPRRRRRRGQSIRARRAIEET